LNLRLLTLTPAAAMLAATMAFGQSPFPSVSGQQPAAPSQFPSVSGQQPAPQQRAPSAFPSVSGGQSAPAAKSAFPSVSGGGSQAAAPSMMSPAIGMPGAGMGGGFGAPQQSQQPPCYDEFMKLRGEVEKRGKALQAAGNRKAPPAEACKLIGNLVEADQKMLSYVSTNAKSCGMPPDIEKNLRKNHSGYVELRTRVCDAAANANQAPRGPSFSDVLGSPSLPEVNASRSGGSTFDTLNGNVLAR
jgi:hypothetical protein